MENNEIAITDKVQWNLSEFLIREIGGYLVETGRHFLNGKIQQAFHTLKVIRQRIIFSLDDDEMEKCIEMEKKFVNSSFDKVNEQEKYSKHKALQYQIYDDYITLLFMKLGKYGYLIKKQEDNTRINV